MLRDDKPTRIELDGQPAPEGSVAAVYRCRQPFEALQDTDHPDIKHCTACDRQVVRVGDIAGFERAVAIKGCVWGEGALRSVGIAGDGKQFFLGGATFDYR